jgi:hypothetical protein
VRELGSQSRSGEIEGGLDWALTKKKKKVGCWGIFHRIGPI